MSRRTNCVLTLWLILFVIAVPLAAAEPVEIDVMSFNIRYSTPGRSEQASENNWTDSAHPRRERVIRVIREHEPDVLGVQEAMHHQIEDLIAAFPQFDFYGVGRDDGKTSGEYAGIFYRKDRFERTGAGSLWLSATPEKPGTSFYTAPDANPRVASWVKLKDTPSGEEFFVLNAHFDHISVPARQKSARLMRKRLEKEADKLPSIVMGDFNAREDAIEVIELAGRHDAASLQLTDSYRALHPEREPMEATYNDWKGTLKGSRIDYILHTRDWQPLTAEIVRTSYDDLWPSDHYPVTAKLRLNSDR